MILNYLFMLSMLTYLKQRHYNYLYSIFFKYVFTHFGIHL